MLLCLGQPTVSCTLVESALQLEFSLLVVLAFICEALRAIQACVFVSYRLLLDLIEAPPVLRATIVVLPYMFDLPNLAVPIVSNVSPPCCKLDLAPSFLVFVLNLGLNYVGSNSSG